MNANPVPTHPLLIELGTEELPPKSLKKLRDAFAGGISESLKAAGLIENSAKIRAFATPRRLAVHIEDVLEKQADQNEQRRGPALQAAYDTDGNPTPAALGFAKSCGVEINQLGTLETDKGSWLVFEREVKGESIDTLAQTALEESLKKLPIAKRMRWGDSDHEFVRPVHWLVALYGPGVLPLETLGLKAGRGTRGHRFHAPESVSITDAAAYETTLESARVIADYDVRQTLIREKSEAVASAKNAQAVIDDKLLDEVTGLVEWPVPILGDFDAAFLDVPAEALISSMKDHQKYFYLKDKAGKLLPHFITLANIESNNPARVQMGNERVIRARLTDAQFFWETDKKTPLAERREALDAITFHVKLGSVGDKVERVKVLAGKIAAELGADAAVTSRAAELCKADLVSEMVGEFASLQGLMGRYYAEHDGEPAGVASAIEQHYWPKFSGDRLPETREAQVLALADRIDTLVGIFATGERPTGVKDPYALRRATLGVIRILIDQRLGISIKNMVSWAIAGYAAQASAVENLSQLDETGQAELFAFIHDRLKAMYLGEGFSAHEYAAIAEIHPSTALDFDTRLRALAAFQKEQTEATDALAAANKRIANILKKSGSSSHSDFRTSLLTDSAEIALVAAADKIQPNVNAAMEKQDYAAALSALAKFRAPVDTFFDEVMVNADDEALKNNRLALISQIRDVFLLVADVSQLVRDT